MNKLKSKAKPEKIIINRLAAVLKEEQISNKSLAAALNYEETTVSKWTTNSIQPPLSTFLRIALVINRDLKDFFISTKDVTEVEKKRTLKILVDVAEKGKRTGKNK